MGQGLSDTYCTESCFLIPYLNLHLRVFLEQKINLFQVLIELSENMTLGEFISADSLTNVYSGKGGIEGGVRF